MGRISWIFRFVGDKVSASTHEMTATIENAAFMDKKTKPHPLHGPGNKPTNPSIAQLLFVEKVGLPERTDSDQMYARCDLETKMIPELKLLLRKLNLNSPSNRFTKKKYTSEDHFGAQNELEQVPRTLRTRSNSTKPSVSF
jgi:hypothetical protein